MLRTLVARPVLGSGSIKHLPLQPPKMYWSACSLAEESDIGQPVAQSDTNSQHPEVSLRACGSLRVVEAALPDTKSFQINALVINRTFVPRVHPDTGRLIPCAVSLPAEYTRATSCSGMLRR